MVRRARTVGFVFFACVVALVTMLIVLWHGDSAGDAPTTVSGNRRAIRPGLSAATPTAVVHRPKPQKASRRSKTLLDSGADDGSDDDDKRTPTEKALAERIEKALDDEDFQLAVSCSEEAQSCAVAEIRQSMVETLGWFGEKALPELTPFLADDDEDVRESAKSEWTMALSSINDDGEKIRAVELALHVLRDEDALEEISGEYIGVDEKLAVESLVRVISAGGSAEGVAKAKETYEFVTGDEWAGVEAAERWIAEEYSPSVLE